MSTTVVIPPAAAAFVAVTMPASYKESRVAEGYTADAAFYKPITSDASTQVLE